MSEGEKMASVTVNDKRRISKDYSGEVCRVCCSRDVHSHKYDTPTMDCIKYLRDAERRGFERARNLAISWFANNGYEALKQELENLKYEEA